MPASTDLPTQFGRYRIVRKLGEGGMGAVYLAEDTQLARQIALKVPHFRDETDTTVIERFHREAKVAAGIEHPGICPVYDIGQIDGIHYLTMPFIDGVQLSRKVRPDSPFPPGEAARLVCRLALAVQTMHDRGVIHRDLKPGNVLLRPDGEPVVMDFGLARSFSGVDRLTATGAQVGTPAYMSPEQIMGQQEELGPATDIYSLGVILFELLTGRVPFTGPIHAVYNQILHGEMPSPSRLRPELSPQLDAICHKAMAKDQAQRFASMTELAAALSRFVDEGAATQPPLPQTAVAQPTRPGVMDATIPTGPASAPDLTEAPPTRMSAAGSAPAAILPKKRFRVSRRFFLIGTAAVLAGAAILVCVLYLQGVFDPAQEGKKLSAEEEFQERVHDSVKPHASKGSTQVDTFQGKPRYNYSVWLEGPDEILNEINEVQYHFDPELFTPPIPRVSTTRRNGFQTIYLGTGAVNRDMDITLVMRDGKRITLQFNVWRGIYR
jgi:serine/threonine protein kinase